MTATSPYLNHPVRTEREAVLEAENKRMREAAGNAADWLNSFHRASLEEIAADGGVTVGMVFQRDAAWEATKLHRAALAQRDKDGQP
jgi:hypothetical protein